MCYLMCARVMMKVSVTLAFNRLAYRAALLIQEQHGAQQLLESVCVHLKIWIQTGLNLVEKIKFY